MNGIIGIVIEMRNTCLVCICFKTYIIIRVTDHSLRNKIVFTVLFIRLPLVADMQCYVLHLSADVANYL
jgi:hypothetical protein